MALYSELLSAELRDGILPRFLENSAIHGLTPAGLKFSRKKGINELLRSVFKLKNPRSFGGGFLETKDVVWIFSPSPLQESGSLVLLLVRSGISIC